jgi:hypothetical protein
MRFIPVWKNEQSKKAMNEKQEKQPRGVNGNATLMKYFAAKYSLNSIHAASKIFDQIVTRLYRIREML